MVSVLATFFRVLLTLFTTKHEPAKTLFDPKPHAERTHDAASRV